MLKKIKRLMIMCMWPTYVQSGAHLHAISVMFKSFLFQRVLRINSHVPWPVHPTSQLKGVENIKRGNRTPGLGLNCYIDGRNGIIFGENVLVGPKVSIISMNHDLNERNRYVEDDPIRIGDDSWLATGCIILSGVTLGKNTVVAAGSVVTKSFPSGNQVIAGNPAKVIKVLK